MIRRPTLQPALGVLGLFLGISCSSPQPPVAPQVGPSVTGDLRGGCDISSAQPQIVWSADGSEIYYVAYGVAGNYLGALEIKAAKADGSGTRVVQTATGDETFDALASPPDGSAVYYDVDDNTEETSGTIAEALTSKTLPGTATASVMAASSDDRHLAYGWRSAFIYDLVTGGSTAIGSAPNGSTWWALAFSPGGDQLLAAAPGTSVIVDLAGNLVASTPVPAMYGGASANWNATGARLFFSDGQIIPTYQLQNVTTGTITPVTPSMKTAATWTCSGWSHDGTTVAFWSASCTGGASLCLSGEDDSRTDLYLADASSGTTTWVAGIGDSAVVGDIAFSPDGTRIAYVWNRSLYVSPVP
jgi:hypothetical protein